MSGECQEAVVVQDCSLSLVSMDLLNHTGQHWFFEQCLNQSEIFCVIIAVQQMVKETTIADSQEREWMIAVHNGHHLRM